MCKKNKTRKKTIKKYGGKEKRMIEGKNRNIRKEICLNSIIFYNNIIGLL